MRRAKRAIVIQQCGAPPNHPGFKALPSAAQGRSRPGPATGARRMAEYSIVIDDAGHFAVESRTESGVTQLANGFATETEAREWIDGKQRHDDLGNDFA
jgi:hypothetical protein